MTDMESARSVLQTFRAAAIMCLFLVTTEAAEVRGKVGGEVELECSIPPSTPRAVFAASLHVVEWVRQGLDIPVLIKFGSYAPRVHPQYEGRVSLVRITALKLEGLQLDDQGSYECRILLLDKPADELQNGTWTVLSVTAPPTFTEAPPSVLEALVGSYISLTCVAIGNPPPTITWLKDGNVIQRMNNQQGALSLRAVSVQSAGQYTCHASNSEGNVTRVTKVEIKGPPVIIVPPKSLSLNMSQNALLRCQAVANPPNMTYVWLKDGENVYHVESLKSRVKIMVDGTLLISRLIPKDSGNYTCMPTNGLLTPPTASANLTVMHPAQALKMPSETYLPTGMDGVVTCPASAQPPLVRVDWTRDGEPLDLSLFPGWTLTAEGSLFMATVNDDAAAVYTCTPYNSYGSMGLSGRTRVILQDPPSFSVTPEKQYKQGFGTTLRIPCQGNTDSTIKVTWSKVDLARRTSYSIEPNGSLLLQPLTKDHQGVWECTAANRVATVKAITQVFVLGTSPHAATSLSVSPGAKQANVSWEASFDGGSAQTFSVWVKEISASDNDGKQEWFSVPVPPFSGTKMQVTGLSPDTEYQFSVLSQNKMGTGPFSEIITARTLDPPPRRNKLKPPSSLSAQRGSAGVVLQWSLPDAQHPPVTGFVLQSRTDQGEWLNLDEDISANSSEIVVPGLHKDCVYELRLLSRRGELLSEPSPSVNVSTLGMEIYPASSRLLEFVPEPLLAGVMGGVGFMCLALLLLLGSACIISHKRDQRCRRRKDEPPPAIYKCSPSIKTSGTSSPDSVLKKSLLPASTLYPTTSSTTTSSSSHIDYSSFNAENHHRRKPLLSGRGGLTRANSSPISPAIELIARSPDGRFILPSYDSDTLSIHSKKSVRHDQHSRVRRSVSLHSERGNRKEGPFVLSVDLPPCKSSAAHFTHQTSSMSRDLTHHGPRVLDQKSAFNGFPDQYSMCSSSSLATVPQRDRIPILTFPVLPHIRHSLGQPSTTASTLLLQMEHERERGNLSHCLKLALEREGLERELQKYTLERSSMREMRREYLDLERSEADDEPSWEYKSRTLPHRYSQGGKDNYSLSLNHFNSSPMHWEDYPHVSPPSPVSTLSRAIALSPSNPSCFDSSSSRHPASSFTEQTPLRSGVAGSLSDDRLTPPHLSSKHHQRHESVEAAPEGYDNSPESTLLEMQTNDSCSEARRQNSLSHGSLSKLSFRGNKYVGRSNLAVDAVPETSKVKVALSEPTNKDTSVEMSVDEPELEVCVTQPAKPMLHHRIASHVRRGHSLTRGDQYVDMSGTTSFNSRSPASADDSVRVHSFTQPPKSEPRRAVTQGPKVWHSKQRSRSLDSRRRKESNFLTPDAWIDSLSQENCAEASSCRPRSLFWEPQTSPSRKITKSPANSPSATLPPDHLPSVGEPLPPKSSPERPTSTSTFDTPSHYEPSRENSSFSKAAKWPVAYQEVEREEGSFKAVKGASRCLPPEDSDQDALEVETGGYEGVPESGGSYSSYASSGRGSMEPANGRLSLCHFSPTFNSSPETAGDSQESTEDKQMEPSQRRKASVDENYEWDTADFCSQSGESDGLIPSLNILKPATFRSLPGMQYSSKALKNCTQLSLLPGHHSSCSTEPEPDTVLF